MDARVAEARSVLEQWHERMLGTARCTRGDRCSCCARNRRLAGGALRERRYGRLPRDYQLDAVLTLEHHGLGVEAAHLACTLAREGFDFEAARGGQLHEDGAQHSVAGFGPQVRHVALAIPWPTRHTGELIDLTQLIFHQPG